MFQVELDGIKIEFSELTFGKFPPSFDVRKTDQNRPCIEVFCLVPFLGGLCHSFLVEGWK